MARIALSPSGFEQSPFKWSVHVEIGGRFWGIGWGTPGVRRTENDSWEAHSMDGWKWLFWGFWWRNAEEKKMEANEASETSPGGNGGSGEWRSEGESEFMVRPDSISTEMPVQAPGDHAEEPCESRDGPGASRGPTGYRDGTNVCGNLSVRVD